MRYLQLLPGLLGGYHGQPNRALTPGRDARIPQGQKMPLEALVDRLFDAGAKARLEDLLRAAKERVDDRRAFKISGTKDELKQAAIAAVEGRHVTRRELARLVDEVEENGAQHIFFFTLTPAGRAALTAAALGAAYSAPPAEPTEALYSPTPASRRTFFVEQDGWLVVKQVFTAEFWELSKDESEDSADRRVRVWTREKRRAVNLLRVQPTSGVVEIRIDRAKNEKDDKLVQEMLAGFETSLEPVVDLDRHLRPLPLWRSFGDIARSRDGIYLTTDVGRDGRVRQSISNERVRGSDVRDHRDYRLAQGYDRDELSPYWALPAVGAPGDESKRLHTVLSRLPVDRPHGKVDYAKAYVAARPTARELEHVLARIRQFAAQAH